MNWQIAHLNVDVNTNQATMIVESLPNASQTLTLNFVMPETMKLKPNVADTLDNVSRAALIAQAKKVLADVANAI